MSVCERVLLADQSAETHIVVDRCQDFEQAPDAREDDGLGQARVGDAQDLAQDKHA